ncbi:MAG TPA: PEP/pyruvate-binding domain-containing protein [Microlunatus sp.]
MLNKAGRQVVDLGAIGPDDLALVGGKALNLGRMLGADLPVPAGFCVPTSAYRWVVGDRLDDLIAELAVPEDRDDLGGVAARIRDRVLATPVPDELAAAIAGHYRSLGDDVPVAVRSSATAEDLPGASFAGQQDTYLNVVGADAVLDATRRCWASLWTERAVSYRTTQGIDHAEVSLAVVVQRMIDAEVAGVMFTANPVTGNRRQLVIDASPGLGESVVSGAVNPDRFVLDATTGATVETTVGDKRSAVLSIAGGGTRTVDLSASAGPCLTHAQLNALTALATSVAAVYESPQDTEWAIDADGRVWLTQARAITTLYPVPGSAAIPGAAHHADRGDRAFLCVSLAQGLTRPITPMGRAAFRLLGTAVSTVAGHPPGDRYRGPSGLVDAGERIFVDITPALRHPRARRVAVRVAGVMEARTKAVLEHLEDDPRFGPDEATTGPAWPLVLRLLARTRAPLRLAHALISPISALHRVDQIEQSVRDRWQIPASATPTERLDAVEERLGTDTFLVMPSVFPYAAAGLMSIAVARRLAPDLDPVLFAEVRRGLPHNVTTEMDLDLWRLASRIGADPDAARSLTTMSAAAAGRAYAQGTLPAVIQDGLGVFLEAYGHRAVAEIDLGMPRWRDDPSHLLGVLANYLQLDDPDLAPERQFFDGARIAESAIDRIVRDTRRSGPAGPLRAAVVRLALDRARNLIGLRERPKSLFVYALAAARAELQLVGAAAVAAGAIADRDDIFFLDLPQARRALDGIDHRDEVRRNRESYAVELKRRHIPRMLLSDGTEPETSIRTDTPDGALIGSPASVGLVTGLARVILDPAGAHLEPGEILVAPSTDPGWTPLFLTAAGLVMEMGGSMSHGAVVAREYGLPAVVGVPDATSRISTGQWITVDGAAGSVVIAESQSVTGAEKVTRPDPDDADAP